MNDIFLALIISLGIQIILFLVAFTFKTDKLTDISYSLTFLLLGVIFFVKSSMNVLHLVLLILIFLWSARLGTYLLIRISKMGKDSRFDKMRNKFFNFLGFWIIQGLTIWIVLIPSFFFFSVSPKTNYLVYLGLIIWVAGFLIESIADIQKYNFKNRSNKKDSFIKSGLWKYSRHPNYFGEFLMWVGIYLFVFNSISLSNKIIALVSPLFILTMLLFVSGIPMLERSYEKRYGKEWLEYKNKTSKFILLPNKK